MQSSKKYHHGSLKRALLDSALAILDKKGEAGVTIRAVSSHAGVSHAAPAKHFKDRRALLTKVATTIMLEINAEAESRISLADSKPFSQLEAIALAFHTYAEKYPHRYDLLWRRGIVNHDESPLRELGDSIYETICSGIDRTSLGQRSDRDTLAIALWSTIHGYIDLRHVGMFEPRVDSVSGRDRFIALLDFYRSVMK